MDLIALAQPVRTIAWAAYALAGLILLVGIGVNILFVDPARSIRPARQSCTGSPNVADRRGACTLD